MRNLLHKSFLILVAVFALTVIGCQQMGPTEYGVKFRKLPPPIGGVSSSVVSPGEVAVLFPWESIYRFDTAVRDITWPSADSKEGENYVNTRALDGNEVALAVTVRYRVSTDPERLTTLVQKVGTDDAAVRELVVAVARADIRTYMNELRTSAFLDEQSRYRAIDKVRDSMAKRLSPYGIDLARVILNDFRFERKLRDGTVDSSYQDKLTEIQKLREDTERERSRIETVKAKKQQELNTLQASVNRQIAEAEGYRNQAKLRGDGVFEARSNEAKAILAQGTAAVEGMVAQIQALSGPGGRSILRLKLAQEFLKNDPKFVVLSDGGSQGMQVRKTDTNELLNQLGLIEGMAPSVKKEGEAKGEEKAVAQSYVVGSSSAASGK